MQRMNEGSPTARKASPSVEGPCADYAVEEARTALVSCGAHVMPAAPGLRDIHPERREQDGVGTDRSAGEKPGPPYDFRPL